jgi:hypothetical protein
VKPWVAALLSVVVIACLAIGLEVLERYFIPDLPQWLNWIPLLLSMVWAVYEAKRLEMHRYKNIVGLNGLTLVIIGFVLMWIIVFPAFIFGRQKILNGTAELLPKFLPPAEDGTSAGKSEES